jgi:hypothetical protein
MGIGQTFANDLTKLIFNAVAIANIADNASASPSTNLWVSLHTADPGSTGTQGNSEGGYSQYTRVLVARTTGGWAVASSSGQASPVANIDFPQNTSTSTGTFTYGAVGLTSGSTAGKIIASGALSANINFSQNVTPRITTGSSFTLV